MKTKDRCRNQPPLTPTYPRRGIAGLPASDEEGLGVVGLCDLAASAHFTVRRETGVVIMKTAEQSENVYENKGPV
jgi:hypothetical protein